MQYFDEKPRRTFEAIGYDCENEWGVETGHSQSIAPWAFKTSITFAALSVKVSFAVSSTSSG